MNIFYCPPSNIRGDIAELGKKESRHASKVLRFSEGDFITFTDGKGGVYEGAIVRQGDKSVQIKVSSKKEIPPYKPHLILGMGIIKKRDRLEFAVEKATELGVSEICFFRSDHTVKENVRMDRLESTALTAMKQSQRAWLPEIKHIPSLEKVLDLHRDACCLAAHEKINPENTGEYPRNNAKMLLLVGPEGGFSEREIEQVRQRGGQLISLGEYRLRAETAAIVFLSSFLDK